MYLRFEHRIDKDVYQTKVTVDSYGTDQMDGNKERELLSRFPIIINTRDLEFSNWIRRSENVPVLADMSEFGADVNVVVPNVEQHEWLLGDTFEAEYQISLADIPAGELGAIMISREFVAQAYCKIFDYTIKCAIEKAMKDLRTKHRPFEDTEIECV